MSILTFILFASALYFASADEVSSKPIPDELQQLLDVVKKGVDDYFTSNVGLNALPVDDQDYLKAVLETGFSDYTNYLTYLAVGGKDLTQVGYDDIILRFETLDQSFSGIPYQPLPSPPSDK